MRAWILETERVLAGNWAHSPHEMTNQTVGQRFDALKAHLAEQLVTSTSMSEIEHTCLAHFLKVSESLRPRLIQCYDLPGLPRTNNDMEGYIRKLKTRYRRISGRKNWNAYLLRYGQCIAYYDCFAQTVTDAVGMSTLLSRVEHQQWRQARTQNRHDHEDRVKMYRFRHQRDEYLQQLASRWSQSLGVT
jgi:hypothetical protein